METYGNIVIANLQQRHTYLTDTGTTDAYYVSFLPAITSLDAGLQVVFIASSANTGPCTLTVDGYGPASIVKDVNQDLGSGDILSGQVVNVVYDGTYFQMIATPQQTLSPFSTYLIDGGQITWVANYDYIVSAANYVILGTQYSSPQTPITLNPADPTYDRIDLVAVDNTGSVVVIEGTPSSTPQEPSYEPSSQVPLAFILVAAATTQPACAALTSVYAEDLGSPTEWTVVSSTGTMNVNSTNHPRNGSKDIEGTAVALSSTLTFTPDTPFDSTNITQLDLYIRSKGSWGTTANGHRIQISFQTSGGQIGIPATIAPRGTYGFNSNTTGTYQQVAIPRSVFNIPDGAMITSIVFTIKGSTGTMGFYMDDIAIEQNCIVYPPPVGVSGYSGYSGYSGTGISGYSGYSGMGYSGYSGYSGGGLSAITADNGLTANTATNVQLGGTLLQDTTVDGDTSYKMSFTSSNSSGTLSVSNTGSATNPSLIVPDNSGYTGIGTSSPACLFMAERSSQNISNGTIPNFAGYIHNIINYNGTGLTGNRGVAAMFNSLDGTLSGDQSINNATDIAALVNFNGLSCSGAYTLTIDQSTGKRAFAVTKSSFSMPSFNLGTVTHASNFHIASIYSPTGNGTITNYYGILLEDQTSLAPSITLTNRWGIYQEGATDNNYFAAHVGIGTTSISATKLDIEDNSAGSSIVSNIVGVSSSTILQVTNNGANSLGYGQYTYTSQFLNNQTGAGFTFGANVAVYGKSQNSALNIGVFGDGTGSSVPSVGGLFTGGSYGSAIYATNGSILAPVYGGVLGAGATISADTGIGAVITSESGTGLIVCVESGALSNYTQFPTGTGSVIQAGRIPPTFTTTGPILELITRSGVGLGAGIGGSIDFYTGDSSYISYLSNQLISKWTDVNHATRTSEFSLTGVNSASTNVLLQISGAGLFTLTQGLSNYTDDAAAATGGIGINQLYRNGSVIMIRVS